MSSYLFKSNISNLFVLNMKKKITSQELKNKFKTFYFNERFNLKKNNVKSSYKLTIYICFCSSLKPFFMDNVENFSYGCIVVPKKKKKERSPRL